MVKKLLLNKRDEYAGYEQRFFETCLESSFRVDRRLEMPSGTRVLCYARSRSSKSGQASPSPVI